MSHFLLTQMEKRIYIINILPNKVYHKMGFMTGVQVSAMTAPPSGQPRPWLPETLPAAEASSSPAQSSPAVALGLWQSHFWPPPGLGCSPSKAALCQWDSGRPSVGGLELCSGDEATLITCYKRARGIRGALFSNLVLSITSCRSCCRYSLRRLGVPALEEDVASLETERGCLLGLRLRALRSDWRCSSLSSLELSMLLRCLKGLQKLRRRRKRCYNCYF